jgi:hypothetical protein
VKKRPFLSFPEAILGLTGLALIAIGAWRTIGEPVNATTLTYVGGALLVLAVLHRRIAHVKVGSGGVELGLAQELRGSGAPALAEAVSGTELPRIVTAYEVVREALFDDADTRIRLQDLLVERAAMLAKRETLVRDELEKAFLQGTAAVRVLVLGLMLGDSRLLSVTVLRDAIERSLTGNEQYQALRLAVDSAHLLSEREIQGLIALAEANPHIEEAKRTDAGRWDKLQKLKAKAAQRRAEGPR